MTDNERRAHDLAISALPKIVEYRLKAQVQTNPADKNGVISTNADYYKIYKELYSSALSAFNRDFPSN